MWTDGSRIYGAKPHERVAAVFFDDVTARDAITDLKLAGWPAGAIAVAVSEKGKQEQASGERHLPSDVEGKHSVRWKLRRTFYHDLQAHGADLTHEDDLMKAAAERPAFMEVDLEDTLSKVGVLPATIQLLEDRMGPDGLLILVDAGEKVDQVESILVRNRGMLRTVMVTEQPTTTT